MVGQTISGYFALWDTPAHRPSQLSPVSVVTDMFIRPWPRARLFPGARSCASKAKSTCATVSRQAAERFCTTHTSSKAGLQADRQTQAWFSFVCFFSPLNQSSRILQTQYYRDWSLANVPHASRLFFKTISLFTLHEGIIWQRNQSKRTLRVSNQNGVTLLYIMLEIHPSGPQPSWHATKSISMPEKSLLRYTILVRNPCDMQQKV